MVDQVILTTTLESFLIYSVFLSLVMFCLGFTIGQTRTIRKRSTQNASGNLADISR